MNSLALDSLLQKLPYLKYLIDTHGDTSLFDYAHAHYKVSPDENALFMERKKEFLEILRKYVSWRFDQDMADMVITSLSENYSVSTAEHHGPMGHPFFWQSTILRGLVNPSEAIINLCTSHVSLNNSSYPRGLVFHGDGANAPHSYLHIPFFWSNKRMCPVFGLSGYTREDIKHHAFPRIDTYLHDEIITGEQYAQIGLFLNDFVLREDVLWEKFYSSQITRLNHIWWSHMFPDLPPFIPLGAEELIQETLIDHLNRSTIITKLLTSIEIQPFIEEYFNGISCCFDRENKHWTYLFWYLDDENNRHALWREDDTLATLDKNFVVQLQASSLIENLTLWQLIPSWMLVYTILSGYYQLTCFGGFSQWDYLGKIQKAYIRILEQFAPSDEVKPVQSAILNEDMLFLMSGEKPLTALDRQIREIIEAHTMKEKAQAMTLKNSLKLMSSEILRCL